MNWKLLRFLLALTGLAVCAYALYAASHMFSHIGKPDYFTNVWFWKAHGCIPVLFMVKGFLAWADFKEKQSAKRNLPVQ
jgi:hypothetical protein